MKSLRDNGCQPYNQLANSGQSASKRGTLDSQTVIHQN
jgi:hypothetical protein